MKIQWFRSYCGDSAFRLWSGPVVSARNLFHFLVPACLASSPLLGQGVSGVIGGLTASPTSPQLTSQFWNPATVGVLTGNQFETNLSLMGGWFIYDRAGNDPNTGQAYGSSDTDGLAPNLFVAASSDFGMDDIRIGYGTYFPSGAMADFDPEGPQRYQLIDGLLLPWHHQLTLGLRLSPSLYVGIAGIVSIGFFETTLDVDLGALMRTVLSSEDIPSEHQALASRATIPRTWSPAFGGVAGVLWRPDHRVSLGFSATSPLRYQFDGQLNLKTPEMAQLVGAGLPALGIDPIIKSSMQAESSLPAMFSLGLRYQPFGYWTQDYIGRYSLTSLERSLGVRVTNSSIEELKNLNIEGNEQKDSYLIGTIQSLQLWQRFTPGIYSSYYRNAAKSNSISVSRIDFDALMVGGFLKYEWQRNLQLGLEYVHSFMFERAALGSTNHSTSRFFQPPSSDGTYRAGMDRIGMSVKYAF